MINRQIVLPFAIFVGLILSVSPSSSRAELRVGVATEIITPDPLLPVSGGMGAPSPVSEKRGELLATAIVVEDADTVVAIVSVDLLGFPAVLGDRARAKIKDIPPENVLIGASHTHSGPDSYAFPDGRGGHTGNIPYLYGVCDKVAEVVNRACESMEPAQVRIATGKVEGKVAYNYYAPQLTDHRASVIQAVKPSGEVIVSLVNYAIHPEVLGAGVGICSPDLVGPMRERIQAQVGGLAMFINGAQGGMITADNRDLDDPRDKLQGAYEDINTWDECVRIGHQLADEALRIIGDAPVQPNAKLLCRSREVTFPVESDEMWAVVKHSPLDYPHGVDRTITARINYLELGDAKILTIPGEALPNIGFYLKRKLGGKHNLLFGLTNDAFGYILTEVDFQSFPRYDYVSRVSLGEKTGAIYIENALDLAHGRDEP